MGSKALIPFLVAMMLITGVANTILTKYQDMHCVRNCDSPNPKDRKDFEQPVWQTIQMFIGEMGCWLVVAGASLYERFKSPKHTGYEPVPAQGQEQAVDGLGNPSFADEPGSADDSGVDPVVKPLVPTGDGDRKLLRSWRVLLLALPSTCDLTGTTFMNIGLIFVAASIYQMTRGALVLFVGLFSVIFLRSRLGVQKWLALFIVVAGVAIVGLAGAIDQKPTHPTDPLDPPQGLSIFRREPDASGMDPVLQTIVGILLIFCAQIFTASQFVLEEAIMHRYSITPLAMVGWEGVFGFIVTTVGLFIAHFAYGRTPEGRGGYFDATQGWHEMTTNAGIGYTSLLIMISIGGFNFFGLSVTRTVSATSRSTIDTCRTLFIWLISLGLGWESFKWLQVLGFAGLVYGTFLFNDIVRLPTSNGLRRCFGLRTGTRVRADSELLSERSLEHN